MSNVGSVVKVISIVLLVLGCIASIVMMFIGGFLAGLIYLVACILSFFPLYAIGVIADYCEQNSSTLWSIQSTLRELKASLEELKTTKSYIGATAVKGTENPAPSAPVYSPSAAAAPEQKPDLEPASSPYTLEVRGKLYDLSAAAEAIYYGRNAEALDFIKQKTRVSASEAQNVLLRLALYTKK